MSTQTTSVNSPSSTASNKKTIKVAAAIIIQNQRVFCAQRAGKRALTGYWEFPGGKVEPGEDSLTTVVREIQEELNVNIEVKEKLCAIFYEYPDFILNMDCFICHLAPNSQLELKEHAASIWATPKDLKELNWVPADIQIVPQLLNYIAK